MTAVRLHQPGRHVHSGAEHHGEQDEDDAFIVQPEGVEVVANAAAVVGCGRREGGGAAYMVGGWW